MIRTTRTLTAALLGATTFAVAACGGGKDRNAAVSNGDAAPSASSAVVPAASPTAVPVVDTTPRKHHSKLGGALVGAAVGHVLGGHAVAGAAAGAILQHERNKHQ